MSRSFLVDSLIDKDSSKMTTSSSSSSSIPINFYPHFYPYTPPFAANYLFNFGRMPWDNKKNDLIKNINSGNHESSHRMDNLIIPNYYPQNIREPKCLRPNLIETNAKIYEKSNSPTSSASSDKGGSDFNVEKLLGVKTNLSEGMIDIL